MRLFEVAELKKATAGDREAIPLNEIKDFTLHRTVASILIV